MNANLAPILDRISGLSLLVVGDVMLDKYIWGDTRRISPEAPVPVISVNRESCNVGGAANVAANLAALGASASVYGMAGNDEAGRQLLAALREAGVGFDERFAQDAVLTIVKSRVLARHQQVCRLDYEGHPNRYALPQGELREALLAAAAKADAVIVSDYAKGVVSESLIHEIQQVAKFVAIDPKPSRHLKFSGVDLMTPNRGEALELAGMKANHHELPDYAEIVARIHESHAPKNLVITLGEDGMILAEEGRILETIPAETREVYDVSGAGDTAIAVLAAALAAGADLGQAARLANIAAGIVVSKIGAASASVSEIRARL